MHRVGRDGAAFIPHLASPKPEDVVVLVFGEIDVRCHIARIARLQDRPIESVIVELVDRYILKIREIFKHFDMQSRILIIGVVPPIDPIVHNPNLPVYGPLSERVAIRRMLNGTLEEQAKIFDFDYMQIPEVYENLDGSLKKKLSDGHAHIAMDHAHHICDQLGQQIGASLRFDHLSPLKKLHLTILRAWAFRCQDAEALWDLGRLVYGSRQRTAAI